MVQTTNVSSVRQLYRSKDRDEEAEDIDISLGRPHLLQLLVSVPLIAGFHFLSPVSGF
jgi:hypothetical protein